MTYLINKKRNYIYYVKTQLLSMSSLKLLIQLLNHIYQIVKV